MQTCGKCRSVVNVGSFTERRVGAADVVVVARDDDAVGNRALSNGPIEGQGDFHASTLVGVQNARLRTDYLIY